MSKAQYDIYRRKVLDLTRTLVVKSNASADAINRELRALGRAVNDNDPESWKYYLHLAGDYHASDVVMTVKSLDTFEEIVFTKANLEHHLATTREYRLFGSFYRALVARYPAQEDLIKGILNPVDMDTAIAAQDGQILYHDVTLVETNEENLIPKLESWCKVFSRRWMVRPYAQIDDLYVPAHFGIMYMLIPAVVMNIRLGNCHTNYAHSYHIREYLASHQKLDWAVDYMTKKQMLWLYREIRFIERNAGKQSTFKSLIQNVMTERNLPLAEWNMRHSLLEMPDELTPRVEFTRSTLNLDLSAAGVETRNVIEMLEAEEIKARGNSRVMEDDAPLIREMMENSINDELQTKVLESAIIDNTDAQLFTLSDTLLNHWLFLADRGRYQAVITVDNPRTGTPLVLTVKEAFVVFIYVYGKSMGLEMNNLPILPAHFVRKLTTPTRATLRGMIDRRLVDENVLDAIYANINPLGNYISTEAFYRDVKKVHDGLMAHRWIWTTREHKDERGQVEEAAMFLYHTPNIDLGSTENYEQWFVDRGLDMPLFSRLEASLLAETLVSYATGANLNTTTSLREIQTAMLRIMSTLSSYTVQYLQSINTMPLIVTDWQVPRIGNIGITSGDHIEGVTIDLTVIEVRDKSHNRDHLPGMGFDGDLGLTIVGGIKDRIEDGQTIQPKGTIRYLYRVPMPDLGVRFEYYPDSQLADVTDRDTDSYTPMGGVHLQDAFDTLVSPHYAVDIADTGTLTDRWNNRSPDQIVDVEIGGFRYPPLLPTDTYVDLFEMPLDPVFEAELVASELVYPIYTDTVLLPHLEYPQFLMTVLLPELNYPTMDDDMTLPLLPYPNGPTELQVIANELTYPTFEGAVLVNELGYPELQIADIHLDSVLYPTNPWDGFVEHLLNVPYPE